MTQLKSLFTHALLAAALLGGAGLASATTYHVDIATSAFDTSGGDTGYLELYFASFGAADSVTATVSNLHGGLLGTPELTNLTVGADGALAFDSALSSDYFQQIALADDISFDISFDGAVSDGAAAGFYADILNADLSAYLSNAVSFTLVPDSALGYSTDPGVATVSASAVPEPATLLSLFTGLGLMGLSLRRRMR